MLANIKAFLQEPFPDEQGIVPAFRTSLIIGFFIFFFLYAFQPFGLSRVSNPLVVTAMFGLITFTVSILYEAFALYILKIERDKASWTFVKWFVFVWLMVGCIALGNFLYISYLEFMPFSFSGLGVMLAQTFALGIFPIAFAGLIRLLMAQRKNNQTAEQLVLSVQKKAHQLIQIKNYNASEAYELEEATICYIEALQNYVSIHHIKDEQLQKITLRNTLSAVEAQLSDTNIVRCHRSFLVNRERITKVEGNAQGLKLSLEDIEEKVPVSRKYISVFRAK